MDLRVPSIAWDLGGDFWFSFHDYFQEFQEFQGFIIIFCHDSTIS